MKKLMVIERATGKVEEWSMKNVKSHTKPEGVEEMRKKENHERFYFMIMFKGLEYDMAMYEVDKYDLKIA